MLAVHKNQSLLLVGLFVLALCGQSWAQEGAALRRPDDLKPYDKCAGPQSSRSKEFWKVWTDRENVTAYTDESLTTANGTKLKFLEPFYVAQVNSAKTAMLLVRSNSEAFDTTIVRDGPPVGWVKADNLLLSTTAVKTDTFIPKRAFIINDWKEFKDASKEELKTNQVTVRSAPNATATSLGTISGSDIFSYLYKYDQCGKPGWFLVGTRIALNQFSGPEEIITGWIPKGRAAEWDTREAYEPVQDRKAPAHVFMTEAAMKADDTKNAFVDTMQKDRWPADKWRYVLMSTPNSKEAKIGYLGDLKVIDEAKAALVTADPKLSKAIQDFYAGPLTHVNVIFVMDGTASMGPYIKMVASTADGIMGSLKAETESINVTFGALVYRDLKNSPKEQYDQIEPTTNIQNVTKFLRDQKEPTPGADTDFEEALFGGLEIALSDVAKKDQQNIIIIVGDAGNSDVKQPLREAAIRKALTGKTVQLYALHIQRPARSPDEAKAISKFEPDIQKLFSIVSSVRNPARQALMEQFPKSSESLPEVKVTVLEKTAANQEDIQGVATKISAEIRKTIKMASAMKQLYAPCIDQGFEKCTATDPTLGSSTSSSGGPSLYEARAALIDLIAQEVEDPVLLRSMLRDKVQIFQEGWVKLTDPNGGPVMRPVYLVGETDLLFTRGLLNELISFGSADAPTLVKNWQNAIERACGCKTNSPEEFLNMRSGLAFKSLSGFLSREYSELANATPAEIAKFGRESKNAIDRLDKLHYDDSIWFKNYGQKFAWIAAADLP